MSPNVMAMPTCDTLPPTDVVADNRAGAGENQGKCSQHFTHHLFAVELFHSEYSLV
jgi:hypothetical protein